MTIDKKQLLSAIASLLVVALLVAGLVLLVRQISKPGNGQKEYNNKAIGFRVTPPKGWVQVKNAPSSLVVEFESKTGKYPQPTLNVIATAARGTLDQYIKVISENNAKEFKNYKEIGGQRIVVDGARGAIVEYSGTVDNYDLRYSELVAIKNGAYYQVTGTTTVNSWKTYHDAIEASLNSVKLR
jgi:hypothetical protein